MLVLPSLLSFAGLLQHTAKFVGLDKTEVDIFSDKRDQIHATKLPVDLERSRDV